MGITSTLVPANAQQARAIGALVMTGFGGIWMISGANALSLLTWETWLIVALLTASLCGLALRQLQAAQRMPITPAPASQSRSVQTRRRRFGIILAFEWVPIFLVAFMLGRMGHPELILPAIAVSSDCISSLWHCSSIFLCTTGRAGPLFLSLLLPLLSVKWLFDKPSLVSGAGCRSGSARRYCCSPKASKRSSEALVQPMVDANRHSLSS